MLPLRTLFFLIVVGTGCLASIFYHPFIGVLTYGFDYQIGPFSQWWGEYLRAMGLRTAQLSALAIMLGMLFHWSKLQFKRKLYLQETLLIVFVCLIWLSHFWGLPPGVFTVRNALKMTKILLFVLMFSHIVTTKQRYEIFIWSMILLGIYLGYAAYTAPGSAFRDGRLNLSVGGPDFREGNFLGAHFAMLMPFIGVMFLKGGWKSKLVCMIAVFFLLQGIILIRSRGVFLACMVGGVAALFWAGTFMKRHRIKILFFFLVGVIGALSLTNRQFWVRMLSLEKATSSFETLDVSAKARTWAWEAALQMSLDYPLGIGDGNFKEYVGQYDARIPGRDTHNTYLRCLAELGYPGFLVLLLLLVNAFVMLIRARRIVSTDLDAEDDFQWHIGALCVSLMIFLVCAMFITETYVEEFYWLLIFPVLLLRSMELETDCK